MPLVEQDLRSRVQKIMEDVLVSVIGSGLSCAEGLPGMGDLAKHLAVTVIPTDGDEAKEWAKVRDRLEADGLENALQNLTGRDSLRLKIVRATHSLIVTAERRAVMRTIQGDSFPLVGLLEKYLNTTEQKATVVTTNYDRLVEIAVEQAGGIAYSGFTVGGIRRRDVDNRWNVVRTIAGKQKKERTVDVWKVHGSVDWFYAKDDLLATSFVNEMAELHEPAMVAPGKAKYEETHREPYRSISVFADKAMQEAKGFLCLGYGFNDEHVQPKLLARARSRNAPAPIILLSRDLTPAARRFLIGGPCPKYIAFTHHDEGTFVFSNDEPSGTLFQGVSLWMLTDFLKWIWG